MSKLNKQRLLAIAAATGVMGLASQSAFAQVSMPVTANVQNTLTAVVDAPLTFGTIFATTASTGASAYGTRAANVAGATNLTDPTPNGLTFLSLGGAERGQITVTVPPNNTTAFNVTLGGLVATTAGQGGDDCSAALTNYLRLIHSSGDPSIPEFHVHDWELAAGTGATAVTPFTANEAEVTPAFAGDQATFFLGGKIRTECVAGTYQEIGTYTGNLTINVGY